MPVLPVTGYPSLSTIANLVRSIVNDDKAGATGTPGEGQILTNSSVTLQNLMNSAIRDTYRDIRIMGQPTLIKDNYIVSDLPPLNSASGVGVPNPAVQVALTFTGYYDGLGIQPNFTLPSDLIMPMELWERQSGSNLPFREMKRVPGPLNSYIQNNSLGQWEWRTDQIWMNGALTNRDIRIRYYATYVDLVTASINWDLTYVPILDSQECIADKVAVRYAARLGGDALADARESARVSLLKLRQQNTRDRQKTDFQTPIFGQGAGQAGSAANYLY